MSKQESASRGTAVGLGVLVVTLLLGSYGAYKLGNSMSGIDTNAVVAEADSGAATTGSVNGSELYAGNCAGCHGGKAEGGMGPALAATKEWTAPQFKDAVLHGKSPHGELKSMMPHFGDSGFGGEPATDAQVEAIHNFVKSL